MKLQRSTFIDRSLLYLFSYDAEISAETTSLGFDPGGVRVVASARERLSRVYHIAGASTIPGSGSKTITGRVASGSDLLYWREDDLEISNIRVHIETDDGANIFGVYDVFADLGSGRYREFVSEEVVVGDDEPIDLPVFTTPRFISTSPEYVWLNDLQCVGFGQARVFKSIVRRISYDIYALM
jgi:hypothetical protein